MQLERPVSEFNNDEMEVYTDDYSDYVYKQYKKVLREDPNAQVLIEQPLDFSCYVPDGFGTGDEVIVSKGKLHIIDFKYEMGVLVSAENNTQMMLYALGALKEYEKYDRSRIESLDVLQLLKIE